jgi:hypothetical protein
VPAFASEVTSLTTFDLTADGKNCLINSRNQKEGNQPVTLVENGPAELKK